LLNIDLAIKSNDAGLQYKIGYGYYRIGDYSNADLFLKKAVDLNSKLKNARYYLAKNCITLARLESGKSKKQDWYSQALSQSNRLAELDPNNPKYISLAGQASLGAKDYGRAAEMFKKALRKKPGDCEFQHNLALSYLGQKSFREAEATFLEVAKCKPQDAGVFNFLGYIYEQMSKDDPRKFGVAIQNYEKSQTLKPSASVARSIERVTGNKTIYEDNLAIDAENKRIEDENLQAEEYNQQLEDEFGEEVLEAGAALPGEEEGE